MVVVRNGIEQALSDRLFRSMFEERKRVFVDLLGWHIPVLADRYEIDQFDDDEATYIVVTDEVGEHCGSARLLRTDCNGITTYTGVAEWAWFQQILAFGWQCLPLGMPSSAVRGLSAMRIDIVRRQHQWHRFEVVI